MTVGDRVFFAGGVHVTDIKYITIEPPPFKEPVSIGDDAVLGNGCLVVGGVTIGVGAVVGMGAVVTKSIPANEVWIGVPAKYYCTRGEYEEKKRKHERNITIDGQQFTPPKCFGHQGEDICFHDTVTTRGGVSYRRHCFAHKECK